jgi:hypothetical protein
VVPPPESFRPGRERWFFLGGLLAFGAALALRRLGDFDLPWHLALGRAVVEQRGIPYLDPLAFTHEPLIFIEPVSEVPLYGLWRLGGPALLQLAGAALALALGALLLRGLRRWGPATWGVAGLVLAGVFSWWVVRPATLSFLLLAAELFAIEQHRHAPEARASRWLVLAAPPFFFLWASAHGFAILGAALLVGYALYRCACRIAKGRLGEVLPASDGSDLALLGASALLGFGASLLNAAGPLLRLGPNRFAEGGDDFALSAITEFAAPTLDFYLHQEPVGPVVVLIALLVLLPRRDASRRWLLPNAFDLACLVAAGLGLWWMVRTIPLSSLFVAPLLVRRLGPLVRPTALLRWSLASCSWLAAGYAWLRIDTSVGFGFEPRHFPEGAVAWIERQQPRGQMWNFSPFGGYLALRLHPDRLVFMDGRNENARSTDLVLRADASNRDPAVFETLVAEYGMQYAIVEAREGSSFGLPLARSPRWRMVHLDDLAAVYVRVDGPNAELGRAGYGVLKHLTPLGQVLEAALRGGADAQALARDGALAVEQAPSSPRSAFLGACGALVARDAAAFERALLHLEATAPGHPSLAVLLQGRATVGF